MFDWVLEADIYRLKKAALEASSGQERRTLEALAEQKQRVLARRRADVSGVDRGGVSA